MAATFNELMDAGLCTGGCLLAVPKSHCDCRCRGWLHGYVVGWLNDHQAGTWQFPGFQDIDIIHKGERVKAIDPQHREGGWYGRRIA